MSVSNDKKEQLNESLVKSTNKEDEDEAEGIYTKISKIAFPAVVI